MKDSCVTSNAMCRLDWSLGKSDIWSNIILCLSVRGFLDEIKIELVD